MASIAIMIGRAVLNAMVYVVNLFLILLIWWRLWFEWRRCRAFLR